MSALPRPDVTGPARTLNDALHDLHHRAGWPSLRTLARETGVSHTTVSKAFSQPALPTWGTLELLVEAMDGSVEDFRALWLAASAPTNGDRPPTPRIAGRRTELDAVRHHLETGTGLLLVTGEAGIGKTTLVRAASAGAACHVATGHCRPLSTPVPLMPVVDVLRELIAVDHGSWSDAVLPACPAYVVPTLEPLLPELGGGAHSGPPDSGRQRLLNALVVLLEAFHAQRPLALWFEDLPWADSETLDVLELLESRGSPVPVVATWRTDDPDSAAHLRWWDRVAARAPRIRLAPLSREETTDQLALIDGTTPADARVDEIYRRSQGQPLFTEHLATGARAAGALPDALVDLLSRRLEVLESDQWQLVRTLAVADRALTLEQVVLAGGAKIDPVPALRHLVRQRLVSGSAEHVQLRHPLLSEVVRGMLLPGEAPDVHGGVARVLEGLPGPPAAEIAGHWRAARRPVDELPWRVRAALDADARFGRREAFAEWNRVLELWSANPPPDGAAGVDLPRVLVRRIESAIRAGQGVDAVRGLIAEAMGTPMPDLGRAEVLLRAGDVECGYGDVEAGLRMIDEAVAIQARHEPSIEAARVLEVRANILSWLGRYDQVRADITRGLDIAASLDAPEIGRIFLAQSAWVHVVDQDLTGACDLAWQAIRAVPPDVDPGGTIRLGATVVEVLLQAGSPAAAVAAAAADAAALADRWQVTGLAPDALFALVSEAYLRAGDVETAAAWVESRVQRVESTQLRRSQRALAAVDVRRGDQPAALARLEHIELLSRGDNYSEGSALQSLAHAEALLWSGRASDAATRLDVAIDHVRSGDLALEAAALFSERARAEADLVRSAAPAERDAARRRVEEMRSGCAADPFGPRAYGADVAAHAATWHCELQRITDQDGAPTWAGAAAEWDALSRPHDAAYCRWRAAQAALRDGRGMVAARLLRRAAADAREHVPLSHAIARTAAGGR